MSVWLTPALLSLFSFGLWGFFTKLAITYIDSKSALIYQTIGVVIVGVIALTFMNFKLEFDGKGLSFAIMTGAFYSVGCLFYFMAADKGKIVTVVTMTALYPLITILLASWVLKETVSVRQYFGIALACMAMVLMSV